MRTIRSTTKSRAMKCKSNEANNHTVTINDPERYVFDEYIDLRSLKQHVTSLEWAERLATELTDWADNDPEAFTLNQFWRKYGIGREDYVRLMDRYSVIKKAYNYALEALGDKREMGAALVGHKKQYDPYVIMKSLARFNPDYKALVAELNKMRDQAEQEHFQVIHNALVPDKPETPK
jgi:hypothetical protein